MILGDSYITFNRKISNFWGHFVSLASKFRGHLKQNREKSRFFEGQGKPWFVCLSVNIFKLEYLRTSGPIVTKFLCEDFVKKQL